MVGRVAKIVTLGMGIMLVSGKMPIHISWDNSWRVADSKSVCAGSIPAPSTINYYKKLPF